jgi:hypothetical protein
LFFNEGKMGVVRSYGKREIDFLFSPSLPGMFQEKITIENIQDHVNDQSVTVKV